LGPIFTGPGLWLLLSAIFAALFIGLDGKTMLSAVMRTGKQWLPVAGAIVSFILAGQVVAVCGAAELLAVGAAGTFGVAYPAVSPLVGALGGVMTGSNAGSNALFMPFQAEAATTSDGSGLTLAALQNVSGSQSNLLAPQRVVLAATATGLLGREAEIVRAIAPPVVVCLALLILVGTVYG
jgi:lactate permease